MTRAVAETGGGVLRRTVLAVVSRREVLAGAVGLLAGAGLTACSGTRTQAAALPPADPIAVLGQDVVDSVGVNVHESYLDTVYVDAHDAAPTLDAVRDLGVRRVRMGLAVSPQPYVPGFIDAMRDDGVLIMAVAGRPDGRYGTYRTGQSAELRSALTSGYLKNRLWGVEMPNEWDGSGQELWPQQIDAFTAEYTAMLRTIAGGPVSVAASMARPTDYAALDVAGESDYANIHPYAGDQTPESDQVLPLWLTSALPIAGSTRIVASEFGWQTATHADRAVSEGVQAAYLMRTLIWNRMNGVEQSYVYELFDQQPDPDGTESELHYGLVAVTGDLKDRSTWVQRRKPAYVQLQGLLARLSDTGRQEVTSFAFAIDDSPADLVSTPLGRRDGTEDIAAWRRVALLADGSHADGDDAVSVTLRFDTPMAVAVYDATSGDVRLITTSATSVPVTVCGALRILRIARADSPEATTIAASPTAPTAARSVVSPDDSATPAR